MSSASVSPQIDEAAQQAFIGTMLGDVGATLTGALVLIGDRLGLYKALAEQGPLTSAQLAEKTGTHERYVREWLSNQAASGYLTYDPATKAFTLPPEHAPMLADDSSPFMMCGLFEIGQTLYVDEPQITEAFKTGKGFGWHEHDRRLFSATERFFRPGYNANIVANWIPALDGVDAKLRAGAKVADVGCGLGTSTILMARAYPKSRFHGFDYHAGSIALARAAAERAGVADRVSFEVAPAQSFPGKGYDFVACFDCIHDMGDPVGAAAHIRSALADDGTFMMVEPYANDALEDNLNPVGRIFYAASTMLCTPASLSQEVGLGLGAQAGEAALRAVFNEASYTRFRRATETPFNLVFEARP
ncbi:SAM-dependent methyltransferase [Vulcanimicrobium alpinum]|uniref:SAM-dependent methyltransferase n=1 Tax=Vulcanimicrobium alpinum TaxID=3016050 RepID=A0AAN2CAV9_UNVUL|nr:class I SAM-dependent methyltransferase [Vulcanimicrobium alpinum]BDE07769.1 SAM-dependent methyltransferase [Vulcanimicrobium alpinum]